MRLAVGIACTLLVSACGTSQTPRQETPAAGSASPAYVGKVWISTDPSAAPGTLRIFLADGSLVMDSCGETYRIAPWRPLDERRVEWTEDTARIEAEIVNVTSAQLHLRLKLVSEMKDEHYEVAKVPYLCRNRGQS